MVRFGKWTCNMLVLKIEKQWLLWDFVCLSDFNLIYTEKNTKNFELGQLRSRKLIT